MQPSATVCMAIMTPASCTSISTSDITCRNSGGNLQAKILFRTTRNNVHHLCINPLTPFQLHRNIRRDEVSGCQSTTVLRCRHNANCSAFGRQDCVTDITEKNLGFSLGRQFLVHGLDISKIINLLAPTVCVHSDISIAISP